MAGIIDDGDIGLVGHHLELADRPLELEIADIDLDIDGIEARIAEHFRHSVGIPRGLGSWGTVW